MINGDSPEMRSIVSTKRSLEINFCVVSMLPQAGQVSSFVLGNVPKYVNVR
jgi:hypothetical protein